MFIDETVIELRAGDGGNGCWAHEREKYKPHGPPSGGHGGRGGHIIIEGCAQLHTLQDAAFRKSYKAGRGAHGKGSNKEGKSAEDIIIKIPLGTILKDAETGETLLDCLNDGQSVIVAKGGRGGRGNASLMSRRNPNPEHCEPGKPGEHKRLRLILKVLADIGLVGRPNAGKSTFLSRISKAHPKIADYPFTTTEPHLGIVKIEGTYDSFVVADIPGLIEGSHLGKGLGTRFLRHIERTKVLAIMVESTAENPEADAEVLLSELRQYSPLLAEKPKFFILSKNDLVQDSSSIKIPEGWLPISSATGSGIKQALKKMHALIQKYSEPGDSSPK
jgi:GTP-binding protein